MVPASAQDPLSWWCVLCGRANPLKHLCQGGGSGEVDRELVLTGISQMHVGVVYARHHEGAFQVDHPGPGLSLPQYCGVIPNGHDCMCPHSDRGGSFSWCVAQMHTGKHI